MTLRRPRTADKTHTARGCSVALLAATAILPTLPAHAETSAGDRITNVASLSAQRDGEAIRAQSNSVELITAERLDLTLVPVVGSDGPATVVLTNSGNGSEAFDIRATPADPSVTVRGIAIDRDGDGRYDPAIDLPLTGATPPLAPGAQVRLFVLLDSAGPARTALTVTAEAATASGAPGTIKPGAGDRGGDAVVGPTGARGSVTFDAVSPTPPTGGAGAGGASLAKSQAVRAPDGSATPIRGAIITYTLVARFAAAASAARLDDPVPGGTAYVPGSLTLDAAPLSDAADADAGTGDGRAIGVALGDVIAGTTRTIQFQVRIQ